MIYDQHGEEGLKPENGPASGFNPRNAEDIFAEFFGSSPFGFGTSGTGKSYGGFGGGDNIFRTFNEGRQMPKKPLAVESRLPCSLEELYYGSTRKMKISRNIHSNGCV